ncbi:MAG: hypothetical protein LBI72_07725 [Flavobacteriaceae bacterium]|jgi:hypothetical protein|nr:hypothetical protein [Flavobacteriaceae bacterium]
MNQLIERAKAPTPKIFRVLRTVGLTLTAVGAAIVTAPIALPAAVVTAAGYLALAGAVASAVSQITVVDTNSLSAQEAQSETEDERK